MQNSYDIVRELYKDDAGNPFEMTPTQVEIFDAIFKKQHPRVHVMTYTQFGKSEITSMALLTRVATFPEKWIITAPTDKKAKIIMGYTIKHIFENEYTLKKFEVSKDESMERIRRERSKDKLTFRISDNQVGQLFIVSAEAKRRGEDAGNAAMGFGAPNVIEDESALIPDPVHSKLIRMVGGHHDNFYMKIGNPFKNNHFKKSFNNPKYHKIIADHNVGIAEGRLSNEQIEEFRSEMGNELFGIMYACNFPSGDLQDDRGYLPLLTEEDIERAIIKDGKMNIFGLKRMGWDIARGGANYSVGMLRGTNYAKMVHKSRIKDTMVIAGEIVKAQKEHTVAFDEIYIDMIGVGAGVFDRVREANFKVKGVNNAEKADNEEKFANKRAESYWRLREWVLGGGKLEEGTADWMQLAKIKYKVNSAGKLQIISKEELLRDGIESPDDADGLALTFAEPVQLVTQGNLQAQIKQIAETRSKPPSFR